MNLKALLEQRIEKVNILTGLMEKATKEERNLNEEENG